MVRNPLTDRKRRRGQLPRAENHGGPTDGSGHVVGGAGGNRTPVRLVRTVRATTIPESVAYGNHTAGSDEAETSPPDLSPMPTVFPVVSLLSGCHPPLLLPGCGEQAPCAITGHDFSLSSE